MDISPFQLWLAVLIGWLDRQERDAIAYRIPMLGEKRSLNVATAAGVVLYELLRRRLQTETSSGQCSTRLPLTRYCRDRNLM